MDEADVGCERGAMHLETARLAIHPWSHDEADRLLDIRSRIEVVKWLGDGEPVLMKDLDEAHAWAVKGSKACVHAVEVRPFQGE